MFIKRRIIFFCGIVSLAIGIMGIFLPLLPATPFLILATICFAKSLQRMYQWLLTNKFCGEYIANYRENKAISLKHKTISLLLLWIAIGYSIFYVADRLWLQILLIIIALGVTIHIVSMSTRTKK